MNSSEWRKKTTRNDELYEIIIMKFIKYLTYTVEPLSSTTIFLQNTHMKYSIADPWGELWSVFVSLSSDLYTALVIVSLYVMYQKNKSDYKKVPMYNNIYTFLLLILMLGHRQAIFESKEHKLSCSAECRIRTLEVWDTKSPADWMSTHKPTELTRIKLESGTR